MQQVKWFDRKFEFSFEQNIFPSIVERLRGTPILLKDKISKIDATNATIRLEDSWSINENIGHLLDLEPLWQGRLEDILSGKTDLRPADLKNKRTDIANHNERKTEDLVVEFTTIRTTIVHQLDALTDEEIYRFALHPRLKTPMRIMDLFLFVAEHDDHHLARITELNNALPKL